MISLFKDRVTDVRIPINAPNFKAIYRQLFQKRLCFTRPNWIVPFVKSDDGPFWHSGYDLFQGYFGRFIKIKVDEQQTDQQVTVLLHELWNCFCHIAPN